MLCEGVKRGLGAWKRDLLRTPSARLFLITLVCEGGLPLYLVQREHARLRTYFRALFEEVRAQQLVGALGVRVSVQDLAQGVGHELPSSLRQDVVFELSGQLIAKVWELTGSVSDAPDPIVALDVKHPGWRAELPLDLEDDLARAFLNGLVKEARAVTLGNRADVQMRRSLIVRGRLDSGDEAPQQRFELAAKLDLPASLTDDQFSSLFAAVAPSRFELSLVDEAGQSAMVALGAARTDTGTVRLEISASAHQLFRGPEAAQGRALLVHGPNGRIGPSLQFRGALALSALPWVFVAAEHSVASARYDLIAEGSHRAREPEILVAVPSGWAAHPNGETMYVLAGTVEDLP
jgi:hypothetical protein